MNQRSPMTVQNDYPFSLDTRGMTIEEEIAQIEKAGFQRRWTSVWEWERAVPQIPVRPKRLIPCLLLVMAVAVTVVLFCGIIPDIPYRFIIYFFGGLVAAGCCAASIGLFIKGNHLVQNANTEKIEVYGVKRLNPVEKLIREVYFQPGTFSRMPVTGDSVKNTNCPYCDRGDR